MTFFNHGEAEDDSNGSYYTRMFWDPMPPKDLEVSLDESYRQREEDLKDFFDVKSLFERHTVEDAFSHILRNYKFDTSDLVLDPNNNEVGSPIREFVNKTCCSTLVKLLMLLKILTLLPFLVRTKTNFIVLDLEQKQILFILL